MAKSGLAQSHFISEEMERGSLDSGKDVPGHIRCFRKSELKHEQQENRKKANNHVIYSSPDEA